MAARNFTRKQIALAFGATLRAARQSAGLSQDRLCMLCDFDRTYPSMMERGLRAPTLEMVLRLSFALNVGADRLIAETQRRLRGEQP